MGTRAIVLALAVPSAALAQQHAIRFDHIGVAQGLSQRVVTAILQDRTGFMWFGTQGGLNRYDGLEFLVLEHVVGDSTSLADNYIKVIFEDTAGRLWVGTQGGGLSLLNRRHDAFRNFRHQEGDPTSISSNAVYAIAELPTGHLLVGTFGGGVHEFDPGTGRFAVIPIAPADRGRESDFVTSLAVEPDGTVWVGTEGAGALRRDPGADTLRAVPYRDPLRGAVENNVRALLVTARNHVWMGRDDGLYRFESADSTFARVPAVPSWSHDRGTIVTNLLETVLDRIWIGTYGDGLHQLDTRRMVYSQAARQGGRDGIADDRVYRLYRDRNAGYWIGVWGAGVHRARGLSGLFALATHAPDDPGSISSDDITDIYVDSRGRLLVGTFDGGLNIRARGATTFRALRRGAGPRGLPSDEVAQITEDTEGRIWTGFWDTGIAVIDGDRVIARYLADPDDPGALPSNRIRALRADRDGTVWVGSLRGLARFTPATASFEALPIHDEVFSVCRTADGMLWVGTLDGLVAYDPASGAQRRFRPDPSDPGSLSHGAVADLYESPDGTLWVATRGGGVNRVDRDADGGVRFSAVTEAEGLADNDAVGVAGQQDILWIISKNGLSRYHVPTRTFTNFREADGLPSADFSSGSILVRNDTLYLGTGRGMIVTALGGYIGSDEPTPLIITSITTTGAEPEFDGAPWDLQRVGVRYGDVVSIEMALLEFAENPDHRYQYRLDGPDNPWMDLQSQPSVSFASLAPGAHRFESRARNQRGIESATAPLMIDVMPPVWMTAWFRLLLVLGLVGLIVAVYRRRTAAIVRHNERLTESRERMRQLAVGIEGAREAERTRIAREIHDQFGQTLTSLKLDCQWLRRRVEPQDEPTADRIGAMMDLIDSTAQEVRRIGAELRPSVLDNLGLVAAARWQAREFHARTGVTARVEGDEILLDGDRATALFRILQEALTNVARHAGASQVIITLAHHDDVVTLAVEDDGQGITNQRPAGRAFGLIGMQERAETWGGSLQVEGGSGRGTRITVRIPTRTPAPAG